MLKINSGNKTKAILYGNFTPVNKEPNPESQLCWLSVIHALERQNRYKFKTSLGYIRNSASKRAEKNREEKRDELKRKRKEGHEDEKEGMD